MSIQKTWAIIGGGNGGQSMAGHLGILGQKVRLFDVVPATVDALNAKGSITVTNAMEGEGKLEFATTDMGKAMEGADNVILVLPSLFHESIARRMVPHLKDGMTVLLHPEASCGAIAFRNLMETMHCSADVVIGAACTLIYSTRIQSNGDVLIYGIKNEVPIAALPAKDNQRLKAAICETMPWFVLANNVLETENNIDILQSKIVNYLSDIFTNESLTEQQAKEVSGLMHVATDIEHIGDYCENIAEYAIDKNKKKYEFSEDAYEEISGGFAHVRKMVRDSIEALKSGEHAAALDVKEQEGVMNKMEADLRRQHMIRLNEKACSPEFTVIYNDIIHNLEKIGDSCDNMAEAVLSDVNIKAAE